MRNFIKTMLTTLCIIGIIIFIGSMGGVENGDATFSQGLLHAGGGILLTACSGIILYFMQGGHHNGQY